MNHDDAVIQHPRVLLDMSHEFSFEASNGLCGHDGYLQRRGYISMEVESGLRPNILAGFDALVLFHQSSPAVYSPEEIRAVTAFVERGGGLLLYADAHDHPTSDAFPLNRIAQQFGLTFLSEKATRPLQIVHTDVPEADWTASLLAISPGTNSTLIMADHAMQPVIAMIAGFNGPVVAVSGSNLISNPATEPSLRNVPFVRSLLDTLTASHTGDVVHDVRKMSRTYAVRIDPDQELVIDSFRVLYPDNLPVERLAFLQEYLPKVYALVAEEFGYGVSEEKTVIGLMCAGSGWTASKTLTGVGLLGNEVTVVSTLIHELSNSLCVESPVWLGDAGWSAYLQLRVKRALGGIFAASVAGEIDHRIADYEAWERVHGLYDLAGGGNHHIGGGKVMHMLQILERRYGSDVMKRYFAAARRLQADPSIASSPIEDRIVHYFSVATGEDQVPFFATLGLHADRIS